MAQDENVEFGVIPSRYTAVKLKRGSVYHIVANRGGKTVCGRDTDEKVERTYGLYLTTRMGKGYKRYSKVVVGVCSTCQRGTWVPRSASEATK